MILATALALHKRCSLLWSIKKVEGITPETCERKTKHYYTGCAT